MRVEPSRSGNSAARERGYPHRLGLRPEACPMIHHQPLLVLPLVHHLVQQRVQCFVPAVAADVAAADDDLGLATFTRGAVMAKSALHAPRNAYRDGAQRSAEALVVVDGVQARELAYERDVGGIRPLRSAPAMWSDAGPRHRELEDRPSRGVARHPGAAGDEGDDRSPDVLPRLEKAVVDAKLSAAVADDY